MNHTTRFLVVLLAFALPLSTRGSAPDAPIKHRLLFTEYGKGPNRFIELDADGKLVWEFKPPSTTVSFHVLPNGNILFGYGGTPTGVREISSRGETVFDYVSKSRQVFGSERLANGNTLICCATQKRLIEVTPDKQIVWEFSDKDAPDLNIAWISSLQQLKNGNLLLGNFMRGKEGQGVHAIEVTHDKEKRVVWKWEDHSLIKSLTTVRVIGE